MNQLGMASSAYLAVLGYTVLVMTLPQYIQQSYRGHSPNDSTRDQSLGESTYTVL